MTDAEKARIVRWYRAEYRRRTRAIKNGTGQLGWIVPADRIRQSDVISYAESIGIALSPLDTIAIQEALSAPVQSPPPG